MGAAYSLSEVKARLSEVVRTARTQGQETIITVDGEPAARIVPMDSAPRELSDAEVATMRVLMRSLSHLERPASEFDAVELVGEGRR